MYMLLILTVIYHPCLINLLILLVLIYILSMGTMMMVKWSEMGVLIIVIVIITNTVVIIHVQNLSYNLVSDTFVVLILVFDVDSSDMIGIIVDHPLHYGLNIDYLINLIICCLGCSYESRKTTSGTGNALHNSSQRKCVSGCGTGYSLWLLLLIVSLLMYSVGYNVDDAVNFVQCE